MLPRSNNRRLNNANDYPRHVGVYVGNGEFVHASSSKGVMLSRLDSKYWRKAYWTSRRILPHGKDI